MSTAQTIDLALGDFWIVVCLAALVLTPLTNARLRSWALAAVNLGMIVALLRTDVVYIVVAAAFVWALLALARVHAAAAWAGGAVALGLFVAHKLPIWADTQGAGRLNPILTSVGFSYVFLRFVEVARAVGGRRYPAPGLAATINYLLPFHMLTAGPIQSYDDFVAQPAIPPAPTARETIGGLERIAIGLVKKYVVAEFLSGVFLTQFRAPWPYSALELQLNYLWLYLDFSAYSDVAVGVGRLIGVATPENFNHPYLARNPIDYWERWHISLSQFVRRNVFLPLQLTLLRMTDGRANLAISSVSFFVSFGLCGVWHQIRYEWLAWGLYQAAGLSACSAYKQFLLKRLGRKGLNRYMANPWIKALAIPAMFEFAAVGVWIVTYPYWETVWWNRLTH
jgi:alginate O-acetyltransferase complex protein AlgI